MPLAGVAFSTGFLEWGSTFFKRPEARPNFNSFQIDTLIYMSTKIFFMKQLLKDLDVRSKTFRVGLKLNVLVSWF